MSDSNRWGFNDRAEAKLKVRVRRNVIKIAPFKLFNVMTYLTLSCQPDSEKSTTEHLGDKFKGKTDNAASHAQPEVCVLSRTRSERFRNLSCLFISTEREVVHPAGWRQALDFPEQ